MVGHYNNDMISIIVAVADNGIIGVGGKMPWHISEDLQMFKRVTTGHPVVMGRKTFESLGRPLPGRTNIVITRNPSWAKDGVLTAGSLDEAVAMHGVITIRAIQVDEEWMRLDVENDKAMSKEDERKVHRLLYMKTSEGRNSVNIGIRNVHQRLQILYGDRSGLSVQNGENGNTISSMLIQNRADSQKNTT